MLFYHARLTELFCRETDDKASLNGDCTELHVSYVLSVLLSSRPMGWSKETLRRYVPILATGAATFDESMENNMQRTILPRPHS